eukprot:TRINITY_DN1093_c1_g1_i1.p1 TRINITY_DN1093_c1_g1~~TRINITY_DN1093_c1_g1_i1.p1  ORF type:complete len:305 (-),score=87.04 TRINITY_DN1093_c1_g1_i1:152-1066(-)
MIGNGLRSDVWPYVYDRFNIPSVFEGYSSTEGNIGFLNFSNKIGSIGYYPDLYVKFLSNFVIVKCDQETGELYRDKHGFCVPVGENESGHLIGRITDSSTTQFLGYNNDKSSTDKKIAMNVLKKGDKYFLSGDLVKFDEERYYYFVDRLGDTYRWKSENVSTLEVENIIHEYKGVLESAVFGVSVPGCEGKAGMAVIYTQQPNFDIKGFSKFLSDKLTSYAIPVFIRVVHHELEKTGTFKVVKTKMMQEGYKLNASTNIITNKDDGDDVDVDEDEERLYFRDGNQYTLMNKEIYEDLINQKYRL